MFKFCNAPWSTIAIHANGEVAPCLCKIWHSRGPVGNLNRESLEEIVSGELMQEFRNSILDQSFKFCKKEFCGKLWNLDIVDTLKNIQVPQLPTTLYFQDLDYSCNLTCPSCRSAPILHTEVNLRVERILNSLKETYQNFDQTVTVFADGRGEVLVSKTYLNFLNSQDLPKCFKLVINTNGNLLTKRIGLIEKLHRNGQIALITVCFDAANQETYEKVRGGRLDLVKQGVRELVKLGIPVSGQMVVQYENYREILDYRDMCLDLGITFIGLQKILRWGHMTNLWWKANTIDNNPNVDYIWLTEALKEFKNMPNTGLDGGLESLLNAKG